MIMVTLDPLLWLGGHLVKLLQPFKSRLEHSSLVVILASIWRGLGTPRILSVSLGLTLDVSQAAGVGVTVPLCCSAHVTVLPVALRLISPPGCLIGTSLSWAFEEKHGTRKGLGDGRSSIFEGT
jgi:hypothetical protein